MSCGSGGVNVMNSRLVIVESGGTFIVNERFIGSK
jgi:hypothetical protein